MYLNFVNNHRRTFENFALLYSKELFFINQETKKLQFYTYKQATDENLILKTVDLKECSSAESTSKILPTEEHELHIKGQLKQ